MSWFVVVSDLLSVRVVVRCCLCCVVVRHCWVVFVGVPFCVCPFLFVVCPLLMFLFDYCVCRLLFFLVLVVGCCSCVVVC